MTQRQILDPTKKPDLAQAEAKIQEEFDKISDRVNALLKELAGLMEKKKEVENLSDPEEKKKELEKLSSEKEQKLKIVRQFLSRAGEKLGKRKTTDIYQEEDCQNRVNDSRLDTLWRKTSLYLNSLNDIAQLNHPLFAKEDDFVELFQSNSPFINKETLLTVKQDSLSARSQFYSHLSLLCSQNSDTEKASEYLAKAQEYRDSCQGCAEEVKENSSFSSQYINSSERLFVYIPDKLENRFDELTEKMDAKTASRNEYLEALEIINRDDTKILNPRFDYEVFKHDLLITGLAQFQKPKALTQDFTILKFRIALMNFACEAMEPLGKLDLVKLALDQLTAVKNMDASLNKDFIQALNNIRAKLLDKWTKEKSPYVVELQLHVDYALVKFGDKEKELAANTETKSALPNVSSTSTSSSSSTPSSSIVTTASKNTKSKSMGNESGKQVEPVVPQVVTVVHKIPTKQLKKKKAKKARNNQKAKKREKKQVPIQFIKNSTGLDTSSDITNETENNQQDEQTSTQAVRVEVKPAKEESLVAERKVYYLNDPTNVFTSTLRKSGDEQPNSSPPPATARANVSTTSIVTEANVHSATNPVNEQKNVTQLSNPKKQKRLLKHVFNHLLSLKQVLDLPDLNIKFYACLFHLIRMFAACQKADYIPKEMNKTLLSRLRNAFFHIPFNVVYNNSSSSLLNKKIIFAAAEKLANHFASELKNLNISGESLLSDSEKQLLGKEISFLNFQDFYYIFEHDNQRSNLETVEQWEESIPELIETIQIIYKGIKETPKDEELDALRMLVVVCYSYVLKETEDTQKKSNITRLKTKFDLEIVEFILQCANLRNRFARKFSDSKNSDLEDLMSLCKDATKLKIVTQTPEQKTIPTVVVASGKTIKPRSAQATGIKKSNPQSNPTPTPLTLGMWLPKPASVNNASNSVNINDVVSSSSSALSLTKSSS